MKHTKLITLLLSALLSFYLMCIYHVEPNEMVITWNPVSGELNSDTTSGYYISPLWEFASNISTSPIRVCITSTSNSYSCMLAQFNPVEYESFVNTQGFGYYWFKNRISFNFGYDDEYRGFKDIMRGYAYGNEDYKFLIIKEDYYAK